MPTVIIEGPALPVEKKRVLAAVLTRAISQIYDWPEERVIIVIHENPDENVARGGQLRSELIREDTSPRQYHD